MILKIFLVLLVLVQSIISYVFSEVPPTWLTSPYFRANNEGVIQTLTGAGVAPNYTFIFSSNLTGLPNIAYGVKGYEGKLYFY